MALYLVIGESADTGASLPPQGMAQMMEQLILPSLEAMAKLQDVKKIVAGGIFAGARAGACILDAADNNEVNRVLMSLPFWGTIKWTVTPLVSFRERAADGAKMLAHIKAMAK